MACALARRRRTPRKTLLLAALVSCATPELPDAPTRFEAGLAEGEAGRRRASAFEPGAGASRFCSVREPAAEVAFDGSWRFALSGLCAKRPRYGDCVCQARLALGDGEQAVFVSPWKRFDVHNGSGWSRFEFRGRDRRVRFAFPELDRVHVEVRESEGEIVP